MDQYIGEIRLVGYNFAPVGWLFCQGQIVSIAENSALYTLIGTTYGGDGTQSFGLPDLRGRVPIHQGNFNGSSYALGQSGGSENVTLNNSQMALHTHPIGAQSGNASSTSPAGATFSAGAQTKQYEPAPGNATTANMLQPAGQSQPHSNIQPLQALNYIIATEGIYPSQT